MIAYTCPGCLTVQALYPNVAAPADDPDGLLVVCPGCETVGVHRPHPATVKALREWAGRVVAADVEVVCRAVAREGSR